jgi:hypothetical protein
MLKLIKLQREGVRARTTPDFLMALFCQVDQEMPAIPKRPDAMLYPGEVTSGNKSAKKAVSSMFR